MMTNKNMFQNPNIKVRIQIHFITHIICSELFPDLRPNNDLIKCNDRNSNELWPTIRCSGGFFTVYRHANVWLTSFYEANVSSKLILCYPVFLIPIHVILNNPKVFIKLDNINISKEANLICPVNLMLFF